MSILPPANAPLKRDARRDTTATPARRNRTMPNIIRTSAGIPLRVTSTGHLAVPPRKPPCMGYQNACVCPACLDRIQRPITAQPPAPQPWEPKHQEEAA